MLRLTVAWVLVNGLLMAPEWLGAAVAADVQGQAGWAALEAALVVGLIALLPRRPWSVALAWGAGITLLLVTLIGIANLVFQVSLARSLNLFLDLYLLGAVYNLAVGNMGLPMTLLAIAALLAVLSLASFGLARLLAPSDAPRWWLAPRLAGVALVVIAAVGFTHQSPAVVQSRLSTPVARLAGTQGGLLVETWRERRQFRDELASPDSYAGAPGLLSGLGGRDVLLTFIESYGMAALADPEFAAVIRPRLDTLAERMQAAGIHLATGRLVSPTQGGQSWYAHGTVTSGLWLSNQLRYELLLASERETLVDDFEHAGYRTAALMPAITMRWPDGVRLGYDQVHTASNVAYG
jgi:hypothetical protein